MWTAAQRALRTLPTVLCAFTIVGACALAVIDFVPDFFPPADHRFIASFPLVSTALAYVAYQAVRRPTAREWARAVLVALAFLFWAANSLWPEASWATLVNDLAIAAFVVDMFLIITGGSSPGGTEVRTTEDPQRDGAGERA